ncbi:uncharacterized protein LOC131941010 isoform X2 [Physella acuta]|uniref:uncharacterized protein LOC131941010 isoform X2 n=1 Tax=Physella acuta TaxID=109671 RepID=UPI0027DDBBF5|nr:uncharacterized protein LOC131941010 isoform X2 [Physella acuta]
MNTKCKSTPTVGPVPHTLGKSVNVMTICPRPPASQNQLKPAGLPQAKPESYSRKTLRRNSSTGSLPSSKSSSSSKQNSRKGADPKREVVRRNSESRENIVDSSESSVFDRSSESVLSLNSEPKINRKKSCPILTTTQILELCQESDPLKVFEIDLHGKELTEFPDFENFQKLRILDLSGNYLQNISGLSILKELKELKLYDNELLEITGLDSLKDLCSLQLQHNKIKKIGRGLGHLRNLQSLRLDNNALTTLESRELCSCSNITVLDLSANRLESLSAVTCLPNLLELFASRNRFKKSSELTKCKKLQEVDLSWNKLTELSGLANLPNLQILDVSHNQLSTIKTVGKLRSLEELNITGNQFVELSNLPGVCPKLQILHVCENCIKNWDEIFALSGLPELYELSVSSNPITSEDKEIITFHKTIWKNLATLELLDGVHRQVPSTKTDAHPVMRPMSASSILSVRQVDSQIKAVHEQEESLHKSIEARLTSLRSLVVSLDISTSLPETFRTATPVDLNITGVKGGSRIGATAVDSTRTGAKGENRTSVPTVSGTKGENRIHRPAPKSGALAENSIHAPAPTSGSEVENSTREPIALSPIEQKETKSNFAASLKELKAQFSDSESSSPEPDDVPGSSRCSSRHRIKEAIAFAARNFKDDFTDDDI